MVRGFAIIVAVSLAGWFLIIYLAEQLAAHITLPL